MSFSRLQARKQAEARPASTWIERFALPIAVSVMEAQPLTMVVTFVTFMLTGKFITSFANMEGIALLAVSLLWWSMFVEHLTRTRHKNNPGRVVLSLLGWLVALAVVIGPALPSTLRGIDILIFPRFCGGVKASGILFHKEGSDHGKSPKDLHS